MHTYYARIKNKCIIIATHFVAAELILLGKFSFPIFILSMQIKFLALTLLDYQRCVRF